MSLRYAHPLAIFYLHCLRPGTPRSLAGRARPLAYSPEEPPATDYFFQYSWILPGIFDPKVNLREHRYFGSPLKCDARFLFDFWGDIRKGNPLGARWNLSVLLNESYLMPHVPQTDPHMRSSRVSP